MKKQRFVNFICTIALALSVFLCPSFECKAYQDIETYELYTDVECDVSVGCGNGSLTNKASFLFPEYDFSSAVTVPSGSTFVSAVELSGDFKGLQTYHVGFYYELLVSGSNIRPKSVTLNYVDGSSSSFDVTGTNSGSSTTFYTLTDNQVSYFSQTNNTSGSAKSVIYCDIDFKPFRDLESIVVDYIRSGTGAGTLLISSLDVRTYGTGEDEGQSIVEKLEEIKEQDKQHHYEDMSQAESQHDELLNGYDSSKADERNEEFKDKVQEQESIQNEIIDNAMDGFNDLDMDTSFISKLSSTFGFISVVFMALVTSLGDFGIVLTITLTFAVALFAIGWFRGGSD